MNRNTNLNPGDVIAINFEGNTHNLKVTGVIERHGRIPHSESVFPEDQGQYQNPLVKGVDTETGKDHTYDFGYITAIVSRSRVTPAPVNIFQGIPMGRSFESTKGTWSGSLTSLIAMVMGNLPFEIKRKLNADRCHNFFERDKPGLIGYKGGLGFIPVVRKKAFRKWVRQNWTRLIDTVEETHAAATKRLEEDHRLMEDWMRQDMEGNWGMDLGFTESEDPDSCYAFEDAPGPW
jgi:hypothetical protein